MNSKTPDELRSDFWYEDEKNGGIIRSQYDEIKEVLSTRNMEWVKAQYNKLKQHAIENTDFYSGYKVDDIFPVVNKNHLIEKYEAHTAHSGYLSPTHISSTSGSTGTPFSVIQDYKKRMRTIADLKVFGELCDYPSHERMVFFRGTTKNRTKEQEDRENIYYIDCGDLSEDNLENMYRAIIEYQPRIIFSYSSTLIEIAKYIERNNLERNYAMKSALIAGEGLCDSDRLFLEKIFGCKIYRRYSDMEMGILAQDKGDGGSYYLNYGSYFFECLKLECDEPAEVNEVGRIVITDLFNYSFPMIRYDTGDLGIMEFPENEFPVLKEVYGKKMDCVYATNGSLVSPHKLEILMWGLEDVKQWRFVQNDKNDYKFIINGNPYADYSKMISDFKEYLGDDAEITLEFVDEIPVLSSSKRRMIICNYKRD